MEVQMDIHHSMKYETHSETCISSASFKPVIRDEEKTKYCISDFYQDADFTTGLIIHGKEKTSLLELRATNNKIEKLTNHKKNVAKKNVIKIAINVRLKRQEQLLHSLIVGIKG